MALIYWHHNKEPCKIDKKNIITFPFCRHRLAVPHHFWWSSFVQGHGWPEEEEQNEEYCWPHRAWRSLCWVYSAVNLTHKVFLEGRERRLRLEPDEPHVRLNLSKFSTDLEFMSAGHNSHLGNTSLKGEQVFF